MQDTNDIENLFRERFQEYEPEVAANAWQQLQERHIKQIFSEYAPAVSKRNWKGIESRLRKDDPRRPVVFWMRKDLRVAASVLLALLLSGGSWLYFSHERHANVAAISIATQAGQAPATTGQNSQWNNNPVNRGIIADEQNQPSAGNSAKVAVQQNLPSQPGAGEHAEDLSNATDLHSYDGGKITVNITRKMQYEFSDLPEINTADGVELSNRLLNLQKKETDRQFNLAIVQHNHRALSIPCPTSGKRQQVFVELFAGPSASFRRFSDSGSASYVAIRKESTRSLMGFSAGARITKVYSNGLSLRAGLQYNRTNERLQYSTGSVIHQQYEINANGDTVGSSYVRTTTYRETTNKFHAIDIPLSVGYHVGNERLQANINLGPVINIYSWQKGSVLTHDKEVVDITTGKDAGQYSYKTNTGIGLIAAASVYIKIGKQLYGLAEPYYRHNFSSITRQQETLKQANDEAGLRVGLRFDL